MRSPSNYSFAQVPRANIQRSTFNRTHTHKTTFDQGRLVPFYLDEVLPGDSVAMNAQIFGRLATPFVPFMDNLHLDIFYFFVPNRLVWDNWQQLMGEEDDPSDIGSNWLTPVIQSGASGFSTGSLADYFGIPVGVPNLEVSALPFRAYTLIWNEWFRDQNLQPAIFIERGQGPESANQYNILTRNKRHDYFTSCLPWPQKGPGVNLPLGSTAPVVPIDYGAGPQFKIPPNWGAGPDSAQTLRAVVDGTVGQIPRIEFGATPTQSSISGNEYLRWASVENASGLVVNLNDVAAATINSLRQAFQIQRLYERDARSGTRYTEILRSHFGVISPDARLQRPEYLGGTSSFINVTPIAQTSESGQTPQGNLAAMGTFSARAGFSKSFVEHGYVFGLLEVRPDIHYSQGLHRMWSRQTRFDYYWPVLAHLGEQAVANREIYAQGDLNDGLPFGYQERWSEYRYAQNKLTGLMRHNPTTGSADSLDIWHLAQEFTSLPTLSAQFINDATDVVKRVSAVPTKPDFMMDSLMSVRHTRPMPTYSVPGMIDHF